MSKKSFWIMIAPYLDGVVMIFSTLWLQKSQVSRRRIRKYAGKEGREAKGSGHGRRVHTGISEVIILWDPAMNSVHTSCQNKLASISVWRDGLLSKALRVLTIPASCPPEELSQLFSPAIILLFHTHTLGNFSSLGHPRPDHLHWYLWIQSGLEAFRL